MNIVCGMDGCKAGWVAITKDLSSGRISSRLCVSVRELVRNESSVQVFAIDIPIGLRERGPRTCDREARRLLGRGRSSSVFPAPIRPVLAASSYNAACQIRLQEEGKKLSRQAWEIVYKIREVDELLRQTLKLQSMFREVHPEVSFFFLAGGQPMRHSKKKRAGKEERRKLLEPIFGHWLHSALAERRDLACNEDDILDAFAALWTAERIASGISQTIPTAPQKDSFGLCMEIVA